MDKQREKLIELLHEAEVWGNGDVNAEADILLANGVLIPPCKPGDDIWWISDEKTVECVKDGVMEVSWDGIEWAIIDADGGNNKIGTRWCYLTKEDAEKALTGVE